MYNYSFNTIKQFLKSNKSHSLVLVLQGCFQF